MLHLVCSSMCWTNIFFSKILQKLLFASCWKPMEWYLAIVERPYPLPLPPKKMSRNALPHITADPHCLCIMKLVGQGGENGIVGLFSLWCHLEKPPGLVKLSEWMECFFRRPRCTFFHCRTWVCLFLFQIHSIIPDCSKHSKTFCEPHILFSTPARISNRRRCRHPPPDSNTCPQASVPFPPPSFLIINGHAPPAKKNTLAFSSLSTLWNLGYFRCRETLTFQLLWKKRKERVKQMEWHQKK